jgi:hypothetical protein
MLKGVHDRAAQPVSVEGTRPGAASNGWTPGDSPWTSGYHRRVIGYASNALSPLTMGICSTMAWAISRRSNGSR